MERLVSAFRNKFEAHEPPFFEIFGPKIRKMGNRNNNSDLSFANFAEFLSSMFKNAIRKKTMVPGSRYNEHHWAQYSTLCHPCLIDYDYIVKFETMREDAAYVLSKLGRHDDQCLEDKYQSIFNSSQTTSAVFNRYFSTLSAQQAANLREAYSIDYKLFGYSK